jgi:hypothetical protein
VTNDRHEPSHCALPSMSAWVRADPSSTLRRCCGRPPKADALNADGSLWLWVGRPGHARSERGPPRGVECRAKRCALRDRLIGLASTLVSLRVALPSAVVMATRLPGGGPEGARRLILLADVVRAGDFELSPPELRFVKLSSSPARHQRACLSHEALFRSSSAVQRLRPG